MKNQEVKTNIEIEGAILTTELLDYIRKLLNNDNDEIQAERDTLADIVCFIGGIFHMLSRDIDQIKAARAMADLSNLRDYMEKLKKP